MKRVGAARNLTVVAAEVRRRDGGLDSSASLPRRPRDTRGVLNCVALLAPWLESARPYAQERLIKAMVTSFFLALCVEQLLASAEPLLTRVPDGGLQPQALVDSKGAVHLVYFKGEPKAGDLFYVKRAAGEKEFTKPIRVNSRSGDAIAIGTIRGAQIALGKNDRLHVAWNGAGESSTHRGVPMFYTRMRDDGRSFEPERDVITSSGGLDGGGSVAADSKGNVFVVWHGQPRANGTETDRVVFMALSTDDGATFTAERPINPEPTGACGCCGLKTFAGPNGDLYVMYREARQGTERDEALLVSRNSGKSFEKLFEHPWKATTCPMSSAWLGTSAGNRIISAWETAGRVWFRNLGDNSPPRPVSTSARANQKYPVTATNRAGETLIAWVEGAGWQKGGQLVWQVLDSSGAPRNVSGRKDGVAAWTFAAAVAHSDGAFEIIY